MLLSRRHFLLFITITASSIPQHGESFQMLTRKQVAAMHRLQRTSPTLFAAPFTTPTTADAMEQMVISATAATTVAAVETTVVAAASQPANAATTAAATTAAPSVPLKDIYMQGLALIADASGGVDAQSEATVLASKMADSMAVLDASHAVDVVSAAVAMSTTPVPVDMNVAAPPMDVSTNIATIATNALEMPAVSTNVVPSTIPAVSDMSNVASTAADAFQNVQVPQPPVAVPLPIPDMIPVADVANNIAPVVSQPISPVTEFSNLISMETASTAASSTLPSVQKVAEVANNMAPIISQPSVQKVTEVANNMAPVVSQPAVQVTEFSNLISVDAASAAVSSTLPSVTAAVPQPPVAAAVAAMSSTSPPPPPPQVDIFPNLTEKIHQMTESMNQAPTNLSDSLSSKLSGLNYDTITDPRTMRAASPSESTALSDMASSASSFASEASNKFVEASMKSVHDILDKTGDSVKANMPELQKALQANTDRILHTVQVAAMSAGDQLQHEATKAVAQSAQSVQEGASSALNYVGDRTLVDLGKIVFILVQTIGKLVLYVLNAILEDIQGTNMGDVVEAAKHSVQTMMFDASNYATATVNHIGDMTISQAAHNLVYVITEVAKFTIYVLNSVIEFLTGTSASNWAIAASHSIEHSAHALTAQAASITNDVTHVSIHQLSANVGDFSHEVGKVILASSNELSHIVGSTVSVDPSTITSAALDSVTAAVQLTNF